VIEQNLFFVVIVCSFFLPSLSFVVGNTAYCSPSLVTKILDQKHTQLCTNWCSRFEVILAHDVIYYLTWKFINEEIKVQCSFYEAEPGSIDCSFRWNSLKEMGVHSITTSS